jgi:predicted aspartyl protease
MGTFKVDIEVARPAPKPSFVPVRDVLVDTGPEVTWILAPTLSTAGVLIRKKDQPFLMANGQQITRDVGYAILRCGQFETVDEVVFAKPGDLQLLGVRTVEGFNAVVDSRRRRLVAAGPAPAAGACGRRRLH